MRSGAALLVCALVACGGGTGVDIDIYLPDGATATRVEIWIAYEQCYDCPTGIAWTQTDRASGDILFLKDERLIEAKLLDDRWVIHLDVEPGYGDIKAMAIVAYDGDEVSALRVMRNLHIPISTVEVWQVYLHAADPATTDVTTPPSDPNVDHRGLVWARAPTGELPQPTGCLVYQTWESHVWRTEFFVPKSDPDCDGFAPLVECSDYWFEYRPIGSCVFTTSDMPSTCVVGSTPCADGVTNDKTCGADGLSTLTCLPDAFCEHCDDEVPADTCVARAFTLAHPGDQVLHWDCLFDQTSGGGPCPDQHVEIQLPYEARFCSDVKMHYMDRPFTEPQSSLKFGDATVEAKLRNITSNPCLVDVYWKSGISESFKDGVPFLLEVPYDNSTRALYPIVIYPSFQTISCTSLIMRQCQPHGPLPDDGVMNCSRKN